MREKQPWKPRKSIDPPEFYYVPKTPKKKVNMTQLAATTAAGTLGFIAEGVPGAVAAGVSAYNAFKDQDDVDMFSEKEMKGDPVSLVNSMANRAAMRKSGKNPKVKKGKTVRVSKQLRLKVKKVMESKAARYNGQYNVTCQGTIGQFAWAANKAAGNLLNGPNPLTAGENMGSLEQTTFCVPQYTDSRGTAPTWWGGHAIGNTGVVNVAGASNIKYFQMWSFFSPLQYLDAASKMWNNKYNTSTISWFASTDANIQLQRRLDTGAGQALLGVGATPPIVGDLVLGIRSSSVKFSLKNNSQRKQTIQFYHCTPKIKYPVYNALHDLAKTVEEECEGYTDIGQASSQRRNVLFKTQDATSLVQPNWVDIIQHPLFDPKDSIGWSSRWKYQLVEIVMQPGEECAHYIHGPKNTSVDFAKLIQKTTAERSFIPTTVKGFSVEVFCRIKPDMAFLESTSETTNFNWAGNWPANPTGDVKGRITQPVSIQLDYCYDLLCPENAGYIISSDPAGSAQWLNLRRRIKQFDQLGVIDPAANAGAITANEQQPGTQIPAGQVS